MATFLVRLLAAGLLSVGLMAPATALAQQARHDRGATPGAAVAPIEAAASLGPLINIPQTWNNCGPTSVAEVLAYWGINRTQDQTKAVLRGDGNPHGMAPYDVPVYMRSLGMRGMVGVGGTARLVKALVSNGFPVIVSQYVSATDHVGHYRPIQSYDDRQRIFVSSDPYLGQGHAIDYDEFDSIWKSTNRRFIVLYPPARESLVHAVLASVGWNKHSAYLQDLARVRGQLKGKVADLTGYGSHRNYYLSIAWDELQLGRYGAGRAAIKQALAAGANPITARWISAQLPRA
ncbi:MAG TPA: C39 family peptidase [Chloroflexota bacterium]|nr:C39 family peptidase [Chloroflexota bacterium]